MKILKKRRREYKTDYAKRIKFLKSEKPRIVYRKTNKHIILQYVVSSEAQDKIVFGVNSKELLKHGWPEKNKGSLKSIPACYLIGFLFGKKILKQKLKNPIVDFGMQKTLHKTRVYGFIKGLIEAGIKIECRDEFFPSKEKLAGENLKEKIDIEKIKINLEKI